MKRTAIQGSLAIAPGRALPVWLHLTLFALVVLLPLWGMLGFGAWTSVRETRQEYEQQTLLLARRLASDLDRELSGIRGTLVALATSPALEDRDFARFQRQAQQVVPEGGAIVVRDGHGQQLVNTLVPFGGKLPMTSAPGVLAADACVFRSRAVCTSDLYIGTTDHQPFVLLDAPVVHDGAVDQVVNIALRATRLASLLSGGQLPPGWTATVIDRQDRVVAREPDHARFVGQVITSSLREHATGSEGSFRSTTLTGTPVWAAYVRLPNWEWRIAVGVPQTLLEAPLRRSALYVGVAGLLALALSVGLALLYGRRLARSIAVLGAVADAVGGPVVLAPVATDIREVNQVGAALAAAATTLRASDAGRATAQAALQRLNNELEARVEQEIAARQDAQARATHAQRMQALGQLAGGIAHDFNNVLQAVSGCAAMIERRVAEPEAIARFVQLILGAAARGSSVTGRLLAFAQQNDLRAEPIDVAALFAGLQELLSHTLGTHIAVQADTPLLLPHAYADKGQLETVLVNLATNARDAMPGGGRLVFSARAETVRAAMGGFAAGRYVRLTVDDSGAGMDAATLARAVEPFFTTKGKGEGNGLGLAMARGFAEQSGGRLDIDSCPGRGTTVSLWLPVAVPVAASVAPPVVAATRVRRRSGGDGARRRVLLVEDEAIVREVIASQLEYEGYEVLPVAGAQAALALLDSAGAIDALVTDLNMPGMNGVELIRTLRRRGEKMAAILLTGNAEDSTGLALDGAITQNFSLLRKPVRGLDLADRIAALISAA